MLIVDSLSRLAVAQRDPADVKHVFGAGASWSKRVGVLTVIATALDGPPTGRRPRGGGDDRARLVRLDPELRPRHLPGAAPGRLRATGEEELREPGGFRGGAQAAGELIGESPSEAAALLRERIERSASNAELLREL